MRQSRWMHCESRPREGAQGRSTEVWVNCNTATSTQLEKAWRKWRCAGSLPGDPPCKIDWPSDTNKTKPHPVDFANMVVGRNRRKVLIRRLVRNCSELLGVHNTWSAAGPLSAPLPTSDECASRQLSVLASRTVCRTWCTALTAGLLVPARLSGLTMQPHTPRIAERAASRGGLMADPVALCCLRTFSARRSPVARLPTRAGTQPGQRITSTMRGILVDWLFEVAEAYHITRRSLHGCARLLDAALYAAEAEAAPVPREQLQLLGVCCLLLTAKQYESSYPSVGKLCYITDNAYTPQDVRAMERMTIESLSFRISLTAGPTAFTALRLVLPPLDSRAGWSEDQASPERKRLEGLANYLCDLTLMDQDFTAERPMEVAQACVVLAAASLGTYTVGQQQQQQQHSSHLLSAQFLHAIAPLFCSRVCVRFCMR